MRLIDADALRKPIYAEDDNITGIGMTYDEMDAYNCGIKETWKIVEEAPTVEPASPWHRVESKEDLPKESNTYIVYLRQGTKVETPEWIGGEPLSYVTEMTFDRGQMLWRAADDTYNAILSFVDTEREFHVTHWMEKPEPPKEDA